MAATAKWVAVKAAYDLLKELALARPGGGGRRSASEDRRGKEKERRRESRGRREAEAMAEREKEDRGDGQEEVGLQLPGVEPGGHGVPVLVPGRPLPRARA